MPNHISTNLYVAGDEAEVKRFVEAASQNNENFHFDNLFPMPAELREVSSPVKILTQAEYDKAKAENAALPANHPFKEMGFGITKEMHAALVAKYGHADWYTWACSNWGTKWGCYDATPFEVVDNSTYTVKTHYNTAWSPATPFFEKVSKDYPTLIFTHEYADEGGNFVGMQTIINGEVVNDLDLDWEKGPGRDLRISLGHPDYNEEGEEVETSREIV